MRTLSKAYFKELDALIKEYKNLVKPAVKEYRKVETESHRAWRFPNARIHQERIDASLALREVTGFAESLYHHKKTT